MKWYFRAWKNYAKFEGRARRNEYWMFFLFNLIVAGVVSFLSAGILGGVYGVAVLLPSIAVTTRRLHDINKSGWMQLVALIPLAGVIWLIVLLATEGNLEANKYGPNPKEDKKNELLEEPVSQNLE